MEEHTISGLHTEIKTVYSSKTLVPTHQTTRCQVRRHIVA